VNRWYFGTTAGPDVSDLCECGEYTDKSGHCPSCDAEPETEEEDDDHE